MPPPTRQDLEISMKRLALVIALTMGPVAVVSPVEASKPWLCPKYTAQIKKTFPRKDWRRMDAIMWRESKCIRQAAGWNYHRGKTHRDCKDNGYFHNRRKCKAVRSWDIGLWQINSQWSTVTTRLCGSNTRTKVLMNVDCNFRVAKYLYENGGLHHWRGTSGKNR
jgi:hypothetical protein